MDDLIDLIKNREDERAIRIISEIVYEGKAADLNLKDYEGNTALLRAVTSGIAPEVLFLLLNIKEVDVNLPSYIGVTPLMAACIRGRWEKGAMALLAHPEINIHKKDKNGEGALEYCEDMPAVRAKLIEMGATAGGGKRSRTQRKRKCRLVVGKRETCCINPKKGHWCWSKGTKRQISRKMKRNCCR
jgi:hypothetical protein